MPAKKICPFSIIRCRVIYIIYYARSYICATLYDQYIAEEVIALLVVVGGCLERIVMRFKTVIQKKVALPMPAYHF